MTESLTRIVWTCMLGICLLPGLSLATQFGGRFSLSVATLSATCLALIGAMAVWQRVLKGGKLNQRLPSDVEAARREALRCIFPEARLLGWNAPRISQIEWDQCTDAPKSVVSLLISAPTKNLPILLVPCFAMALELGVFNSFMHESSLGRRWLVAISPSVRAVEISLLCVVALVLLSLRLCKSAALKHRATLQQEIRRHD
jgi:hypothetical protein